MFKSIRSGAGETGLVVVGVWAEHKKLPGGLGRLSATARTHLLQALKTPGFKADAGEVITAGPRHLLLGLGKSGTLSSDTLRSIGGRLVRRLDRMSITAVRLALDEPIAQSDDLTAESAGGSLGEGMALANWRVDFFDGSAAETSKPRGTLTVNGTAALRKGLRRGLQLGQSTNYARRIAATPPNVCNPTWMAREARRLARAVGLKCRVISYPQARQLGMGGLVNVGRASSSKPCLIILEHKPARPAAAARKVKLALVGKTITYDTGGYSLKISNTMKGMKYDKNGGMAVLGAMHAIASLKVPVHVVGVLPVAENMVSGDAYRPDDIITMFNGVTVEVTNTDAEGRLVLADALAYACKRLKATTIVDAATLTGGVVVALGSWCAGLWCEDEKLRDRLAAASESTGERLWRMPLWKEHRDFMRSRHADIWNSGPKRDGHPIQGAAFLSYFVDDDIPWAHIDIAGVSAVDGGRDVYVDGPTGFGVRLLSQLAEGFARRSP